MARVGAIFGEDFKDDIIAMYQSGKSADDCGRAFGCKGQTITRLLRRHGVEVRARPAHEKHAELVAKLDEITAFYREGHTFAETAERFGTDGAAISKLLLVAGVEKHPHKKDIIEAARQLQGGQRNHHSSRKGESILADSKDEVVRLYADGDSLTEIADRFGCGRHAVAKLLRDEGVTIRSFQESARMAVQKAIEADPTARRTGSKLDRVREEVIAYYEAGHTLTETGDKFGATFPTVRRFLSQEGVEVRTQAESLVLKWSPEGTWGQRRKKPVEGAYGPARSPKAQADLPFAAPDEPTRYCQGCKRMLPAVAWNIFEGDRASKYCKQCKRQQNQRRNSEEFRAKAREYHKGTYAKVVEQRRALRLEVLAAYGGKCACCGEATPQFLAVDHVHGNGNRHRAYLKAQKVHHLYPWLKKNGYPEGFRLLCHNCNMARGLYGFCPHESKIKLQCK